MAELNAAQIFTADTAAWTATGIFALIVIRVWSSLPALLDKWLAFRTAKAAEKAADWTRLRDEINRLSEAEKRCREDYDALHDKYIGLNEEVASLKGELAERMGFQIGQGKAAQEAAGVIALERRQITPPKGGEKQ